MREPREQPVVVSVGYEGRSIADFIDVLVASDVDVLVDVRLNAISRKKGFSKTALAAAAAAAGIGYRHERSLGNPKENRDPFRQGLPDARERYRRHLSKEGSSACSKVAELARTTTIALLCFERDHATCHRSAITDEFTRALPALDVVTV